MLVTIVGECEQIIIFFADMCVNIAFSILFLLSPLFLNVYSTEAVVFNTNYAYGSFLRFQGSCAYCEESKFDNLFLFYFVRPKLTIDFLLL